MIRYDYIPSGWISSRRCGRIVEVWYQDGWRYGVAHPSGNGLGQECFSQYEYSITCSTWYYDRDLSYYDKYAPCADGNVSSNGRRWCERNSCPKGWGYGMYFGGNGKSTMCLAAQGWTDGSLREPVYGYVTRYRTEYYTYIAGRVSKA